MMAEAWGVVSAEVRVLGPLWHLDAHNPIHQLQAARENRRESTTPSRTQPPGLTFREAGFRGTEMGMIRSTSCQMTAGEEGEAAAKA